MFKDLGTKALTEKKKEGIVSALYVGSIFILLAVIYLLNAAKDLFGKVVQFFASLMLATVPGINIPMPAPANPAAYTVLYSAFFQFCLGLGIIEIIILSLRVSMHSPLPRKAETVENIVFWLATSFLVITYLMNITLITEWFVFWVGVILVAGLSLLTRAFILLVRRT